MQVVVSFFRFQQIPNPVNFLSDKHTYNSIRSYMREGGIVATTWNGPVSFSSLGQNMARTPPTLQLSFDDNLAFIFPQDSQLWPL